MFSDDGRFRDIQIISETKMDLGFHEKTILSFGEPGSLGNSVKKMVLQKWLKLLIFFQALSSVFKFQQKRNIQFSIIQICHRPPFSSQVASVAYSICIQILHMCRGNGHQCRRDLNFLQALLHTIFLSLKATDFVMENNHGADAREGASYYQHKQGMVFYGDIPFKQLRSYLYYIYIIFKIYIYIHRRKNIYIYTYPPLKGGVHPPPLCTLGVLSYIKICIYISPSIHIVKQRWNTYICILRIYLNIYVNKCNSPSIHIVIKNEGTKNSIHLVLHRWRNINK